MKREQTILEAGIGILTMFVTFVFIGIGPEKLRNYYDIPSILIIIAPMFSGALIVSGKTRSWQSLCCAWNRRAASADIRLEAIRLWQLMEMIAYASGVLGTLIGLVNMLSAGMESPAALTNGMAIALLTLLYGAGFGMVCRMMATRALLATIPEDETQMNSGAAADLSASGFLSPQNQIAQPPLSSADKFQYLFIFLILIVMMTFFGIVISLKQTCKTEVMNNPEAVALEQENTNPQNQSPVLNEQ